MYFHFLKKLLVLCNDNKNDDNENIRMSGSNVFGCGSGKQLSPKNLSKLSYFFSKYLHRNEMRAFELLQEKLVFCPRFTLSCVFYVNM